MLAGAAQGLMYAFLAICLPLASNFRASQKIAVSPTMADPIPDHPDFLFLMLVY
jgi:hypothetical protein